MGQSHATTFLFIFMQLHWWISYYKHTVSNELPYYIWSYHEIPVAILIPTKIHVLQANGNTNVY